MLFLNYDLAMVLDNGFLPFVSISRLGDARRYAIGMSVGDKGPVRVLSLYIAIDIFDKEKLLKGYPFIENLLGIGHREVRQEMLSQSFFRSDFHL